MTSEAVGARLAPLEVGSTGGWRPIESAPKDENILVATTGDWVGEARLDYHPHNDNWVWIWAGGDPIHESHKLLAWMPLPEHPTATPRSSATTQKE